MNGYLHQAPKNQGEIAAKNIVLRLKDHEGRSIGEKNAAYVDSLHRMLGIYLGGK